MISKYYDFKVSRKRNYVNKYKDYYGWDRWEEVFVQAMPFDVNEWVNQKESWVNIRPKNSKSKYRTE